MMRALVSDARRRHREMTTTGHEPIDERATMILATEADS